MNRIVNIPSFWVCQSSELINLSITMQSSAILILAIMVITILIIVLRAWRTLKKINQTSHQSTIDGDRMRFKKYTADMNSTQLKTCINKIINGIKSSEIKLFCISILLLCFSCPTRLSAQTSTLPNDDAIFGQPGVIITVVLLTIPLLGALYILVVKLKAALSAYQTKLNVNESGRYTTYLHSLSALEKDLLIKRKQQLDYQLSGYELSGDLPTEDERGLIQIDSNVTIPLVAKKKKLAELPAIDKKLSDLILSYLCCAAFWLVFGTSIGEYLGIKFVVPDVDRISWLSFGRLRPVHTNCVFWGWASLGMLGLGHYVVSAVSNTPLYSYRLGWISLIMINISVLAGTICLMLGLNNGGGEYREYVWPVMLVFGLALFLTLVNFLRTINRRSTKEIYISNWYIVSALIFAITITIVAYLPHWQNGLGETIIQGYYMHQGVGMWFMLFTLGLVYYFLPQQLNRPIYSYSLGILAFWTQILFYTTIGTHHFVFSSIPWWLQTVAIVGSVGMVIPVAAGTTNFLMTFSGAWHKVRYSYSLPFFLVGVIFYFTGSLQGTAEAFRYTNLIWHFTDFTVAHSHLTMYGIITFLLWAGTYAIIPRLIAKEAPQITIGAHFWLAFIGLLFYTVPLMYGSTLRGLMWMDGKPFIDSVTLMAPYWLWRAIGGTLMWLSHLFFAYNLYKMISRSQVKTVLQLTIETLEKSVNNPEAQNK